MAGRRGRGRPPNSKDSFQRSSTSKQKKAAEGLNTHKLHSFFAPTRGDKADTSEEEDSVTCHIPVVPPLANATGADVFDDDDIEYIDPPDVEANLLSEEEEEERIADGLVDEYGAVAENDDCDFVQTPPTKVPSGIQQHYVYEVHCRLKLEMSGKVKGLNEAWLLDHLGKNDWWIRREHAHTIAHKLKLPKQHLA